MYPQFRKTPVLFVAALLAVVVLTLTACSMSGGVKLSSNSALVDMTIRQDEFDQFSLNAGTHGSGPYDNLLDRVTSVELHDGFIRFVGTVGQPDWSEVDASFDLSLAAENNALKASIIAVNIPGMDLNSHRIVDANHDLEEDFTHMVNHSHNDVLFKEVVVEEGVLRLKVQVIFDYDLELQ